MPNSLTAGKAQAWSLVLQELLYEKFVGMSIADTKFENDFDGGDTVHFTRMNKIVANDLTSSYSSVTIQDLVEADETFTLNRRKHWAVELSEEDWKELKVDPKAQYIRDGAEAFARLWDIEIMSQYANAAYVVDDGSITTPSNGGAGNAIILGKTNIYDMITSVGQQLDENNVPNEDRFIVLGPKEKKFLLNAPELLRSTDAYDKTVRNGYVGMVDDFKVYFSNQIITTGAGATAVRHLLAGAGKPICFAANIKPKVQITAPENRDKFAYLAKAQTKYGAKTFTEGAIRLADVRVKG